MSHRTLLGLLLGATTCLAGQKPLTLPDILDWKRIQTPLVSSDGVWFTYKLSPIEGDSSVVLKNIRDGKEQRFGAGETPRVEADPGAPPPPPPRDVVISEDGKWLAFTVYPTVKEGKALKKAKKPLQNKVDLIELATGKKTEFEGIRRFEFAGKKSSAIALQRYAPAGAAPPPAAAPGSDAKPPERPQGSDLILYTLGAGEELNLGNVSEFSFDKPGNWMAWIIDAQDHMGNGISVRNMTSGTIMNLDSAKASYKSLNWTEKGTALAAVRGVEDKAWEDKLYSVVAFRGFDGGMPKKFVYDPTKDTSFPKAMTVSSNRPAMWMADLSEVVFGIHEIKAKPPKKDDVEDRSSLVIWHWNDPRLVSMQQVQQNADKNFSFLSAWLPEENKFVRLGSPEVKQITVNPESKFGIGIDVREYELMTNLDGRTYRDVYRIDLKTGERKLALKKARWYEGASPDASHLLYYEDGQFFSYDMASGTSRNLTKVLPTSFVDTEDDHNVVKPPTRSFGWSKDNDFVLISDSWDLWKIPVAENGDAVDITGNGKKDKIRYNQVINLDPDAKGLDFKKTLYVRALGELTKKGGTAVIEPGKPATMAHFDEALYPTLVKAKNADVYVYSRETSQDYPDFYSSDSSLGAGAKLTNANPQQKDFAWTPGVKLIEYTGARGDKLQGDLYLPANYEAGKKYPTILYMYEKLTQNTNAYPQPGINGFSIGYYTSNGYAVIEPDITYKVNDPGVSSTACILAALKAAIATGVVDPARVGIHGHSWGGYQTAFAVTQTNAFKAAIAGAPLTDMVSMYSSIYWNTGTTNQPIFESSQGRFTGGYLENQDAYIRNSPVYRAQNVQTPLIILSDDKDGAVDHTQGIEYYNTLRRLRKPVVMLEYKGENHGLRKPENLKDYTSRMKEFWDHYLMDKPAPKWLSDGIPLLGLNDELDERSKQLMKAAPADEKVEAGPGGN